MHRLVLPSRTPLALAVVIMYASTYAAVGPDAAAPVEKPAATPFARTVGGGGFRFVAPTDGGAAGEEVRFVEQTGRPMRMYIGEGWIDRAQ